MTKVLVSGPMDRFERYDISPPKDFKLVEIKKGISDEEFIEEAKDATFIFSGFMHLNRKIIETLDKVKLIQSEGVGYDTIDIDAARDKGIPVGNAAGVNKVPVAEHTLGLMLASIRRIPSADRDIKAGMFSESYKAYRQRGLRNLEDYHVGIVGLGNIAIELVKRLKAFNCKISYYGHNRKEDLEKELDIDYLDLEELFKTCDIISLHVPHTEETEHMINKDTISLMKDDVIIVNTARGKVIKQDDLTEALLKGKIGGAALDTLDMEPPNPEDPILHLPKEIDDKLILTTHIAGIADSSLRDMQRIGWENMERVMRGERPINIVNGL